MVCNLNSINTINLLINMKPDYDQQQQRIPGILLSAKNVF